MVGGYYLAFNASSTTAKRGLVSARLMPLAA